MNKEALDGLSVELIELDKKAKAIRDILSLYGIDKPVVSTSSNQKNGSSISSKNYEVTRNTVLQIILSANQFVKASVIVEKIDSSKQNDKKLKSKVSNILAALKTDKKLISFKIENRNIDTYWGLNQWVDSNGKPLQMYFNIE